MDPYLEGPDFRGLHLNLIAAIQRILARRVFPRYVMRVAEYVYLVRPEPPTRARVEPDLFVRPAASAPWTPGPVRSSGTAVLEAPVTLALPPLEPFPQRYLEIRTADGDEVVCVLEILSPTNKDPHTGRDAYLGKRANLLQTSSHLVEFDLLRSGARLPMSEPIPPAAYYVLVSRSEHRPDCGVWPVALRDPLPTIPIPLARGDADVALDLQAALDAAYDSEFLGATVDYRGEPEPPLAPADAAWARQKIAASNVRLK